MIPIKNIYYMLTYAFSVLNKDEYKNIETEEFENIEEMLSEILINGTKSLIKQGISKSYVVQSEPMSILKGKIEITDSIKSMSFIDKKMICTYDEFSTNILINKILKSTFLELLKLDIKKKRKKEIRKMLFYFADVEEININQIDWNIRFNRNNQTYSMLISICRLIIEGLLQTQSEGKNKLMDLIDEQKMHRLYEKFILEYYKKHHPHLKPRSRQINWILDDGYMGMLSNMYSDIMLEYQDRILIIDAKYYTESATKNYDRYRVNTNNIYQLFTYVKNKHEEVKYKGIKVSGMLLYAKNLDNKLNNETYRMSGNEISVRTLDLNCEFNDIRDQLDYVVEKYI